MLDESLADDLLRALRRAPNVGLADLAVEVGLPRTNFGRPLSERLRRPLEELLADGLVDERRGRYRLSDRGRRTLAERALGSDDLTH